MFIELLTTWVASKVYMIRDSFTLHATQCSLYFDKHRENKINSLISLHSVGSEICKKVLLFLESQKLVG